MIIIKLQSDTAERCAALAGAMKAHIECGLQLLRRGEWHVWQGWVLFSDGAAYNYRSRRCSCLDFRIHRLCSHIYAVDMIILDVQRPR